MTCWSGWPIAATLARGTGDWFFDQGPRGDHPHQGLQDAVGRGKREGGRCRLGTTDHDLFIARLKIVTTDHKGILADISTVLTQKDANILQADIQTTDDRKGISHFTIEVENYKQLQEILGRSRKSRTFFSWRGRS